MYIQKTGVLGNTPAMMAQSKRAKETSVMTRPVKWYSMIMRSGIMMSIMKSGVVSCEKKRRKKLTTGGSNHSGNQPAQQDKGEHNHSQADEPGYDNGHGGEQQHG